MATASVFAKIPETSLVPLVTVQVCILTFRRPQLLPLALESIRRQTVFDNPLLHSQDQSPLCYVSVELLVIDNDEGESARQTATAIFEGSHLPGRYICESRRGLSSARNRALQESLHVDFVVFLDDDETARNDWLAQLLCTAIRFEADVVTGPVEPVHEESPKWIVSGGFFSAVRRETGQPVKWVASNNTLLSSGVARKFRFDSHFDSSGGEDTEFFMRVAKAGYHMVWSEEARVSESVPASRANLKWILRRAWSDANRFTLSLLMTEPGLRTVLMRLATAGAGTLAGIALLPGVIIRRHYGARGLQLIARASGTISALRGRSHSYYEPTNA